MRTVTLAQLRDDVRLWADVRTGSPASAAVSDPEIDRLLNLQLAEFHELVSNASAAEDIPLTEATIAFTGAATADLPDDFFRMNAAWIDWNQRDRENIRPLTHLLESAIMRAGTWARGAPKAYRIRGQLLELHPTPPTFNLTIRYLPAFQDLVEPTDTYDGINGWEKVITMGAALEVLIILRQSNPSLEARWQEQKSRVMDALDRRQEQEATQVRDVSRDYHLRWWESDPEL